MDASGARAHRITTDRGYRTPVFSPDGRFVAAIAAGTIRIVSTTEPPVVKPRELTLTVTPAYLLGWTQKAIAAYTIDGAVIAVDAETGNIVPVVDAVTQPELEDLIATSRTCGTTTIIQGYLPGTAYAVSARHDIGIYYPSKETTKMLTDKNARKISAEPAYSADCKRVAFVSS